VAALGCLLIIVQVIIASSSRPPDNPNEISTRTVEHKTTIVPGVLGGGLLVLGLIFVFTAHRRDEPPAENAVK